MVLEEGLKGGGNCLVGMVLVLVLGMGDLTEFEFGGYFALGMGLCVGGWLTGSCSFRTRYLSS